MNYTVTVDGRTFNVEVGDLDARPVIATVDGERFEVWPAAVTQVEAPVATLPVAAPATNRPPRATRRTSGAATAPPQKAGRVVYAPLPGVIDSILVQPGDALAPGQELCVVEAMKMKNIIRASHDGKVGQVHIHVGQHVKHNDPLVEYAD